MQLRAPAVIASLAAALALSACGGHSPSLPEEVAQPVPQPAAPAPTHDHAAKAGQAAPAM